MDGGQASTDIDENDRNDNSCDDENGQTTVDGQRSKDMDGNEGNNCDSDMDENKGNDYNNACDDDACYYKSSDTDDTSEFDFSDTEDQTYEPQADKNSDSDSSTSNSTHITHNKKKKPKQAKHLRDEDTYVENSSSDGDMSDVYPAITLQAPVAVDIDNDVESDDEDLDEDFILRDVKNKNIYITKVVTSSTSKTGKAKKHQRVYNSYQFCGTCEKKVSNLSQHLIRNRQVHGANEKIRDLGRT